MIRRARFTSPDIPSTRACETWIKLNQSTANLSQARRLRSAFFQPPGNIKSVISNNYVDPCAFKAGERLKDDPPLVDPAAEGSGLDHGVLAGDVVGRDRHAERVLDAAGDVKVGQSRFDHDDVGALCQVESDLANRLITVGRVQLVAAAIA